MQVSIIPKIDGILDDDAWQGAPLEKDFITYDPTYGEVLPHKTLVWMVYDKDNLYFAFRCDDPEPHKIKTSITKRDAMFTDDWVAFSIDSLRTRQTAYNFFINPNGIQGDELYSAVSGADLSPDFVWESAGRLTAEGYQVEVRIPLQSLRFKRGKQLEMGVLFRRHISRLGITGSWPRIEPGQGILNTQTSIYYKNLAKRLKMEVLPAVTYGSGRERMGPDQWGETDTRREVGIGFTYGITSSITADITFNPDFSQVESDAYQVEVNQRYPVFYREKRPFFMEGGDIFSFFNSSGFIGRVVHTRRIVDPAWGIKLTGTVGKLAFGILSASDEWPGQVRDDAPGKNAFFGSARGKYSLGEDNYIGVIYSGREFAGEYNRVVGADMRYRLGNRHKVGASFLHSMSSPDDPANQDVKSSYYVFDYLYASKSFILNTMYEHIGTGFRMDTGFLYRAGLNQVNLFMQYNLYPSPDKLNWLKRISPGFYLFLLHDLYTDQDEYYFKPRVSFNFTKQGYLLLQGEITRESWQGDIFNINLFIVSAGVQLTRWLQINGSISYGDKIYYYAQPAFKGKGIDGYFSLNFQGGKKFNQSFSYVHTDFSRKEEKFYDVNIINSTTTYQFNKYFFLRAIFQYDSYEKLLLTDYLASFTLIPGTVLHVGYGGLYENRKWREGQWLYREGNLINIRRSFFFKASYLWRF
jgi:hypothetical protein